MTPIEQKYQDAGGASGFLGSIVTAETATPGGLGSYAEYQHGIIYYNPIYGAAVMSEAITAKWKSDSVGVAKTAENIVIRTYLGFPIRDSFPISNNRGQACYFERGMIVVNNKNAAFVTYGDIYLLYKTFNDVNGWAGLPIADERAAANGGRVSLFEGADIYTKSSETFEVHGAIRDRYNALSGPSGFLGYPTTNETLVMKNGREAGRYNMFKGGSIYWSGASGAWEVHGSLRESWQAQFNGPAGELGFPLSNETASAGDNYRFNNFQNGVLVWQASSGNVRKITKLDFEVNSFEGRGDDGLFGGDVDVYVKMNVSSSDGFHFQGRYPSDGDTGAQHNFEGNSGLFCTIPVRDGNMIVTVDLDGWDSDTVSDDHLGESKGTYTIDNLWDATTSNSSAQGWNGDFKAAFNLKPDGYIVNPFDAANFRRNLFWSFLNTNIGDSIGELTKEIFASTFSDVGQDEHWYFHPFNALFLLAYQKMLSPSKGVCFGMSLESIYAIKGASSSNEPISQYPIDEVRKNQIAIKHGYQLGGDQLDFFIMKFLGGDTHDPVKAFNESRDVFNRGEMSVLSLSNNSTYGKGHAVVPYYWDNSNPNACIMKVANPNTPFSKDSNNDSGDGVIIVNAVNNSFTYQHGKTEVWSGDSSSGGRMLSIPYGKLSSTPRTPFWEAFAILAAATLIIMADGGSISQITDGNGNTFYKADKEINEDPATRIMDMVEIKPAAESGNRFSKKIVHASESVIHPEDHAAEGGTHHADLPFQKVSEAHIPIQIFKIPEQSTMHYLKSGNQYDPMYAKQFTHPGTTASGTLSTTHFTTMAASKAFAKDITPGNVNNHVSDHVSRSIGILADAGALHYLHPRTLHVEILNNGESDYSWGLNTGVLNMHVASPSVKGSTDVVTIDGIGLPGQAFTFKLNETAPAKKIKMTVGGFNDNGVKRMFEMPNINLVPGQSVTVQVSNASKELIMHNTGPELTFDLNLYVSTHAGALSLKTGLSIDANAVATIAPDQWADTQLATTAVRVNISDKLGGATIREMVF